MDEIFDLIGPDWTFVRMGWQRAPLNRMVRNGWLLMRTRTQYRLVRLTALGLAERDRRDAIRARKLSRKLHG